MSNFEKQLSSNIKWQPEMSLCIPRMDTSTSIDFIITTFNRLNLCKINKIIELPLKNTIGYKRVILNVVWHHTDRKINQWREHKNSIWNAVVLEINARCKKKNKLSYLHDFECLFFSFFLKMNNSKQI